MGHVTLVLLPSNSVWGLCIFLSSSCVVTQHHKVQVIALEVLTWNPLEQTYEFE